MLEQSLHRGPSGRWEVCRQDNCPAGSGHVGGLDIVRKPAHRRHYRPYSSDTRPRMTQASDLNNLIDRERINQWNSRDSIDSVEMKPV
jgi:hypothetical protein